MDSVVELHVWGALKDVGSGKVTLRTKDGKVQCGIGSKMSVVCSQLCCKVLGNTH